MAMMPKKMLETSLKLRRWTILETVPCAGMDMKSWISHYHPKMGSPFWKTLRMFLLKLPLGPGSWPTAICFCEKIKMNAHTNSYLKMQRSFTPKNMELETARLPLCRQVDTGALVGLIAKHWPIIKRPDLMSIPPRLITWVSSLGVTW